MAYLLLLRTLSIAGSSLLSGALRAASSCAVTSVFSRRICVHFTCSFWNLVRVRLRLRLRLRVRARVRVSFWNLSVSSSLACFCACSSKVVS